MFYCVNLKFTCVLVLYCSDPFSHPFLKNGTLSWQEKVWGHWVIKVINKIGNGDEWVWLYRTVYLYPCSVHAYRYGNYVHICLSSPIAVFICILLCSPVLLFICVQFSSFVFMKINIKLHTHFKFTYVCGLSCCFYVCVCG